jgi:alkylation response protein AidB-like acyl-CoA dehydrogenase
VPPEQIPAAPARQSLAQPGDSFDLAPSDEQEMLVQTVREFALARLRPAALEADANARTPDELIASTAELGLAAIGVPDELGGVLEERSAVTAALIAEALAEGDMGLAVACLAPAAVATVIGLWGDAAQQAAYLAGFVAERTTVAALAIQEPQPLFDPFALRTRATREPDGDFVLDGVKALVPGGAQAELIVVAAELDGVPALFIVESGDAGIEVEPSPAMGLRAAATATLRFNGKRLPASALLGESDPQVYCEIIALGRLAWCAMAVGTSQAVLDYVSEHVNSRIAFGEPISNRQSVAFMVANIAIELDGMRLVCQRGASHAESGRDFIREAALARALTERHAMQIGSDGVQLLGGHGYTKEHPVERWYRDLRAAGMLEGVLAL